VHLSDYYCATTHRVILLGSVNASVNMMDVDESESCGVPEDASNGALENNGYVDPPEFNIKQLDLFDTSSDGRSPEPDLSEEARMKLQRKAAWRPTGCCYDDRMKLHANSEYSDKAHHPEDPRRIEAIMREFKDAGLIFSGSNAELQEILKESPTRWMYRIAARKARKDEICTVHVPSHYDWVEDLASKTAEELRLMTAELDQGRRSLYVGNLTFEASLISCGGAIETCKNVVEGNCKNGIAVIRPPGHHAEHNEALGFCLFNNVCVAARVCQQDYPQKCRKVLILDWDVHHGNGIQNIFYEDPNVLYISLHVYQDGEFYPGQPEIKGVPDGGNDKCGAGAGIGRNVNIGWHDQKMGDGEYMAAFQRIVMPIAREFDPDLVIVAAGFDAAAGDDLGGCLVSPAGYSHMTHMLMSLADGKVAVCLEGGYNLRAISKSALAVAKTLMGEPPMRMAQPPPCPEAAMVLDRVREFQAPYWACMRPGPFDFKKMDREKVNKEVNDLKGVRLDDVVRIYQRRILTQKHKMVSLFVQREKIARHFEDQVLATQGLHMAKQILLIIHDPYVIFPIGQWTSADLSLVPSF
jgi:histone deacetylase 6